MCPQLQADASEPDEAIRAFNNWYAGICAHPVMGDFYLVTDNAAFDIAFINYYLAVHLGAPPLTNRAARNDQMSNDSDASAEEPRSFIPPVDVRSLVCGLPTSMLTAGRARRHQFLPAPWGSAKALCRNVLAKACPGAKTHMPDDDAFIIGWHFGQLLSYLGEQAAALQSHLSHAAALGVTGNDMAMPGTFLHYALGLQHLKHGSATGAASARVPGGVSMATTVTFSPPGQQQQGGTSTPSRQSRRRAYSEDQHATSGTTTPPLMQMSPPPSATRLDLGPQGDIPPEATTPSHTPFDAVSPSPAAQEAASSAMGAAAAGPSTGRDAPLPDASGYVQDASQWDPSLTTRQVPVQEGGFSRKSRVGQGWEAPVASAAKSALVTPVVRPVSEGGAAAAGGGPAVAGDSTAGNAGGVLEAQTPSSLQAAASAPPQPVRGHEAVVSAGNPLGLLPPVGEFLVPSLQSIHNVAKLTFKYNQGHYGKPGGGWVKCFPVDALVHDLMGQHGPTWAATGFHPLRLRRKRGSEGREYEFMVTAHDGSDVPSIMVDRLCGVLMEAYAMAVTFCRGGPSHAHCDLPYPAQDDAMWFHPASGSPPAQAGGSGGGQIARTPPSSSWANWRNNDPRYQQQRFAATAVPLAAPASALHALPEGDSLRVQPAAVPTRAMQYRSEGSAATPPPSAAAVPSTAAASPEWRTSTPPAAAPPAQNLGPAAGHSSGEPPAVHGGGGSSSGGGGSASGLTFASAMEKMGWSMQGMAALASMNPSVWSGGGGGGGVPGQAAQAAGGVGSPFGLVPAEPFTSRRRGAGGYGKGAGQRRRPRSQSEDVVAIHAAQRGNSGTPSKGSARGKPKSRSGRGGHTAQTSADGKSRRRQKSFNAPSA